MLQKNLLAALALACAALACKGGSTPAPAVLPSTCSGDAECSTGFRCDREQRRCVCTGDDACPGKFCNAFTGLCVDSVPGCTSDAACGAGSYCDRALRTCKPVTAFCQPCRADAQCGAGSKCAANPQFPSGGTFCVPSCQTPADGGAPGCANGLSCLATSSGDHLCYPANGACGQSNACVPDSLKLCPGGDADCGDPAQTCDATLKQCVTRTRTCPAGDACDPQSRLCQHACGSDADCVAIEGGPGYQCRANACFKRALCAADSDCTSGQICAANPDGSKSCRAGCVSSNDCPLGQGCSTTDPSHPRCAAGCTQSSDCPLNNVCSNGACVGSTANCQQACQATNACPIGAACQNNCCVGVSFQAQCQTNQPPCKSCEGSGCPVSCSNYCFPFNLGHCNITSDCQGKGYPSSVYCNTAGGLNQCQVSGHLLPCSGDADCGAKGFRCVPASQLCGGASGGICFPYEAAAQVACAVGHP